MANSIDTKVVSIEFNNASFESKIAATLKSVENLQKSLTFEGAKAGFADLSKAADGVTLNGISEGIEGVSNKFIALTTIGVTALATLTTKAIEAGLSIAKSLSLQPITQGFQEYELKMGAIQTIMAGSGASLEEVNAQLQALNTYSDQTIYSFADMTQNIGKFTNAGVNLETSVGAIKGIANVAALSGANAEEAARSMYNFAQSISSGSVKLMDWKSIELANMATVEFKTQLLESAVAAGTLTKEIDGTYTTLEGTPVTATKGFNDSLQEQWLTSEALISTLNDYSDATTDIGARATAAATEVKTFTQLMSTVKESVGSGWASSFEILFGNFEEAKSLWTGVNAAIGDFVGKSADARNALLQGWKDLGGRALLIDSLGDAFYALGRILEPIKEAFRSVFPKTTSEELFKITQAFALFTQKLIPSQETIENLKRGFQGFFYGIKIGIDILKGVAGVISDVIDALIPEGSGGGILGFFGDFGSSITKFYGTLLASQAIPEFFAKVSETIVTLITNFKELIGYFTDGLTGMGTNEGEGIYLFFNKLGMLIGDIATSARIFFSSLGDFDGLSGVFDGLSAAIDRVQERWSDILSAPDFGEMLGPFEGIFDSIKGVFEEIQTYISDWFSGLGDNMAAAAEEGDYSKVLDTLNVGLLAGIAAILGKFMKDGIGLNLNLLGPDVVDTINTSFSTLTDTMKAMQTSIKADALLKIAGAIALLTASVLVLSMIDSGALTKALTAMAVGFGQLMGSMLILTKMDMGPASAVKMGLIAVGLIALSGALLILSLAIKVLSTMSWEELAKGLSAVSVLLISLSIAAKFLSANSGGLIRAGLALVPIAIALNLLAIAMKVFATMNWEDIGKGMVGIAGSLLLIAGATQLMPASLPLTAAGLVLVGVALNLIAAAMKIFATMKWEEIGKGLVGVGGALLVIAAAMQLMPITLPVTAAGLILVGIALGSIAAAMKLFATMEWEEIGRGLAAMAGALLILGIATAAMTGSVAGAIALGIVTLALMGLVRVVQEFSKLSLKELGIGLLGIASVLVVLAGASLLLSAAIGPMMALGVALALIGGGFALFGIGVAGVARGIQILAKAGKAGVEVFLSSLELMLTTLPKIATALAEALLNFLTEFLGGLPVIIEQLGVIVGTILDTLIELIPKFIETVGLLITGLLDYIIEAAPKFVEAGMTVLLALLQGISDNIGEITTTVADIIIEFLDSLTAKMPEIVAAGMNLLAEFLRGIADNLGTVITAVADIIIAFIEAVVGEYERILTAGADALAQFLLGIANNLGTIITTVVDIITQFITDIATEAVRLLAAGAAALAQFLQGIGDALSTVLTAAVDVITQLITDLGTEAERLVDAGLDAIVKFLEGVGEDADEFMTAAVKVIVNFIEALNDNFWLLANEAARIIIKFMNALADSIEDNIEGFRAAGGRIAWAIADGMSFGLLGFGVKIAKGGWNMAGDLIGGVLDRLDSNSPSKVFIGIGEDVVEGFAIGLSRTKPAVEEATNAADNITTAFQQAIEQITAMDDFNPTITPVLDLTQVTRDAKLLKTLYPDLSSSVASNISAAELEAFRGSDSELTEAGVSVNFVQNNNSPKALSTNDIYRQTRNQIAIAKEELSIR